MSKLFANCKPPRNKHEGLTYDEWKADGYSVRRGEQASGRNADGKATFTRAQVTETGHFNDNDDYDDRGAENWARSEWSGIYD